MTEDETLNNKGKEKAGVFLEERPLITRDPEVYAALIVLKEKGYTFNKLVSEYEKLTSYNGTAQESSR